MSDILKRLQAGIGTSAGRERQADAYYQLCCDAAEEIQRLSRALTIIAVSSCPNCGDRAIPQIARNVLREQEPSDEFKI